MSRCFVVMPYGSNEAERKEFSRVYKFLIKATAEEVGLECVRSDIEGRGGHILSNVIEDITDSDIVVADLSNLNWNVAYELGMRHVIHKKGTILICNKSTTLPFDVQSLNVILYPDDWLDYEEELCEKLKKAFEGRLNDKSVCDSPVHDKYSFLPGNVIRDSSGASNDSLREARERISQLERELAETHKKMEAMGISLGEEQNADKVDYTRIFLDELENSIYSGEEAIARLRELLDEGDKRGFLEFLGKMIEVGFIDENDCQTIYKLCKKLDIPAITRKYLEAVINNFCPDSDYILELLADENGKTYHTSEQALHIVNGLIGVSKKDGEYVVSKTSNVNIEKLGCFFNVYFRLKKYSDIVEVGHLLVERFAGKNKICSMIYRNMTDACIRMDDLDLAGKFIEKTMEYGPTNPLTYWMRAKYENHLEKYPESIDNIEICISLEPTDIDYYFIMSSYICDDLFARNSETLQIEKIEAKKAGTYVIPFLLTALTMDRSCIERTINFLRRNKFTEYVQPIIEAYKSNVTDFRTVFDNVDFTAVDFCFEKKNSD